MTRTTARSRYSRWTWSIAALLIVLLLALWRSGRGPEGACCGVEATSESATPVSPALAPPPPMQSAAKMPGTLLVRVDGDKRVIEGTVYDEATKTRVLQAANTAFGDTNVVDKIAVDPAIAASKCVGKADALFAALKTDPPIGIACDAHGRITLTGTALSDADKASRERWAHEFFGADAIVANEIAVAAVTQPVSRPEDVRCAARMPAAVTFKTASSRIDSKGRALLDAIVPCLKDGRYEIAGYTDGIGRDEDNLKLSKARAESVRAYVILKGIDADRVVATGYGASRPLGDNGTAAGRASNRRIEFVRK